MDKKYAIVDIETTGGLYKRDRITEIAIVITDGNKILDKYESLVNPGISIPPNITRITGITNEMVEDAPSFYEIAKDVVTFLEGCIFVAHNVQFDYSFIQNEFASLGYSFTKRRLCTVKLSRKAFPKLKSYSLGNLIRHFNIIVQNRHRAMDDALATTVLFHKIANTSSWEKKSSFLRDAINISKLPDGISMDVVNKLPTQCGVYYMLDSQDEITYIGKSINIQKRVKQHFSKVDKKTGDMLQSVASISFEITGSELVSLLKEAEEIREWSPKINKALKKKEYPYCVINVINKEGYISLQVKKYTNKVIENNNIITRCTSLAKAKSTVTKYTHMFDLCKKINKLEKGTPGNPCFDYSIDNCLGACANLEEPSSYNERLSEFLEFEEQLEKSNFFLFEKGRDENEKAIILIEEGNVQGYGYIHTDDTYMGVEEMKEAIKYMTPDRSYNRIVNTYMTRNTNNLELISF